MSDADIKIERMVLNRLGSLVWKLCDGKHSVEEIRRLVYAALNGGSVPGYSQVAADIDRFLSVLREKWLVRWSDAPDCDFLLVVPPYPSVYSPVAADEPEFSTPPLGLLYVAAALERAGFRVAVADMHVTASAPQDILRLLEIHRPRIVGISSSTPSYPNARRIAKFVKAASPDMPVVMGGVHPTAMARSVLAEGDIDVVVRGEGEATIVELAQHYIEGRIASSNFLNTTPRSPSFSSKVLGQLAGSGLGSILGISYRTPSGEIVETPTRPFIRNLDDLPYPARHLVSLSKYFRRGSMSFSRGCPAQCNFCSCGSFASRRWRVRKPHLMVDEMEYLQRTFKVSRVDFNDDEFTLARNQVRAVCDHIRERQLDIEWSCFGRASDIDQNLVDAMYEAGCRTIQYGVESGNQRVLDSIGKGLNIGEIENAVVCARRAGIPEIACGFIIGHPDDTEETVHDTIHFALRLQDLGATMLSVSVLTPYPGTEVYHDAERLGIKILSENWDEYTFSRVVMETKYLSANRLRELYFEALTAILDGHEANYQQLPYRTLTKDDETQAEIATA